MLSVLGRDGPDAGAFDLDRSCAGDLQSPAPAGLRGGTLAIDAPDHGRGRDRRGDDDLRALHGARARREHGPACPELSRPTRRSSTPTRCRPSRSQTVPNDPDYVNGDQWQLNGTWGVNAPAAWNVTTGSDTVIVADVDTGLNYNLPDIYDNVWLNQPEIPASVIGNLTDVEQRRRHHVHRPE